MRTMLGGARLKGVIVEAFRKIPASPFSFDSAIHKKTSRQRGNALGRGAWVIRSITKDRRLPTVAPEYSLVPGAAVVGSLSRLVYHDSNGKSVANWSQFGQIK
jgi:hypothetical protein